MSEQERQAMNASANYHSRLGDLAFEQGWEAAMRYVEMRDRLDGMDDIDRFGMAIHAEVIARRG